MSARSEAIIAKMRARTQALAPAPEPVQDEPGEVVRHTTGVQPQQESMRPHRRMVDRKCDLRARYPRRKCTLTITASGMLEVVLVEKRKGLRGGRKPRYKTDHSKRRIRA